MSSPVVRNFMRQQGFPEEPAPVCDMRFQGLYFQPRIVGPLVVVAIVLHSAAIFFALSAVLWWNVLLPAWNPFERAYNRLIAARRGKAALTPAPGPRRFAQGMAAAFLIVAGVALAHGWVVTAWIFEGFLVMAFAMLLFGKFCLGAYVYFLLRGQFGFANATLPWARR
ncbi:MAG: DUF4395 domain-containing protein [Acidobacteriia bacterium]|nr:DUF4395 domain-containing protein [Terriglobia bacterium]